MGSRRTGGAQRLRNGGAGGLLGQRWEVSGGAVKRASMLPALPFPLSFFPSLIRTHPLPPPPFLYLNWPTEVVEWGGALRTGNDSSSFSTNTREVELSVKL